ncbi:MAG: hypothetical protein JO354_06015 [Verrucomicrobia bacterium]|nr:hypothetical protein [Verrucomicrobiota bacterium]
MLGETVFQQIEGTLSFIGCLLFFGIVVLCLMYYRVGKIRNGVRELVRRQNEMLDEVRASQGHLRAMGRYYEQTPVTEPYVAEESS